ncbi:MAG: STAS domain-containing protein [Actinomycetota bacterium]
MDLLITQSESGKTRTVRLEGSCDLATAPTLKAALQPLVPPDVESVVLDLAKLEFIDSTGLGVVLGSMRRLREGGGTLEITGAAGIVKRVLEITDLDKVIPIVVAERAE